MGWEVDQESDDFYCVGGSVSSLRFAANISFADLLQDGSCCCLRSTHWASGIPDHSFVEPSCRCYGRRKALIARLCVVAAL
jgi:hypothetical protein